MGKIMNANEEANLIAGKTFVPKSKNILRLLDDNGFRGLYTAELDFDMLTITFTGRPAVVCDLSSEATHAMIYEYLVRKYQEVPAIPEPEPF
jgi:hypothetical protein